MVLYNIGDPGVQACISISYVTAIRYVYAINHEGE